MIDRRVFVKAGGLALVSLGLDPLFLARAAFAARRPTVQPSKFGLPLPTRRRRWAEHDRAAWRAAVLPGAPAHRDPSEGRDRPGRALWPAPEPRAPEVALGQQQFGGFARDRFSGFH